MNQTRETISDIIENIEKASFQENHEDHCGFLDDDKYHSIQNCSFWVEGVAMSVFGFLAIITNGITIYAFSRYGYTRH